MLRSIERRAHAIAVLAVKAESLRLARHAPKGLGCNSAAPTSRNHPVGTVAKRRRGAAA
jgi:hypothetical protein